MRRAVALLPAILLASALVQAQPDSTAAGPPRTFNLRGGATEALADSLRRASQARPWLPPGAADDSLAAYWSGLDATWDRDIPRDLLTFDLPAIVVDSLSVTGQEAVTDLASGRWRLGIKPLGRLGFNRVEGLRPGVLVRAGPLRPDPPELRVGLGYGISARRPVWDVGLHVPLLNGQVRPVPDRPGALPWTRLALELHGGRTVRMFAGDQRPARLASGLIYGHDPNHYFDQRGGQAELVWRPRPWLSLRGGGLEQEHRPLPLATSWNLASTEDEDPNWQVPRLRTRAVSAGLGLGGPRLNLAGGLEWDRVDHSGFLASLAGSPDQADFRRSWASFSLSRLDRHGNELLLVADWAGVDRRAPLQWKTFLGDYGTLRGYDAQALVGDRAAWASLDLRWGLDLFRALRVPLLGRLGLQPITFCDWGRTWLDDGPLPAAPGLVPRAGWRADAGFGLGKLIGLPGLQGNLRLYVARPVLDGTDGGWRVVLGLED